MKKQPNPREAAMALATQAELLPKLRDEMLMLVNKINAALNTSSTSTKSATTKRKSPSKSRRTRKATYLKTMPAKAMPIPGVSKTYMFVPGLGIVSKTSNGKVRLLRLPATNTWGLRTKAGERLFISVNTLAKKLGMELGL